MSDLFASSAPDARPERQGSVKPPSAAAPLAARMRPESLDEVAGQEHILGEGKLLRRAIEADRISSILLYGPPGVGKTSLAQVIALTTESRFERLSGVESTVADIRRVVASASNRMQNTGARTILFVDEIHRFNKAQQDVLLPDVENGTLRLIGATTHNPFFYVNSALVSRSQIFELEPILPEHLRVLMLRALADKERGLGQRPTRIDDDALQHLAVTADGDARKCLNALEVAVITTEPGADGVIHITRAVAEESIQRKAVVYDADGDQHYDTISAFIKSMRGGDPDAALYWLAKMIHAGEDPRFIARRIVICASEDVGLADSQALQVAVAAHHAVEFIGMPEGRIPLAHATVYVATAPKSNRAYAGIGAALSDVRNGVTLPVPKHLRSTAYKGSESLGHGKGYQYAHDSEEGYIPQAYLPEGKRYYEPTDRGMEKRVKERLDYWRSLYEAEQGKKG